MGVPSRNYGSPPRHRRASEVAVIKSAQRYRLGGNLPAEIGVIYYTPPRAPPLCALCFGVERFFDPEPIGRCKPCKRRSLCSAPAPFETAATKLFPFRSAREEGTAAGFFLKSSSTNDPIAASNKDLCKVFHKYSRQR